MALFGRGSSSRPDDPRRGSARDTSRQFMAVAEEFRRAGRLREAIETLERGARDNPGYVAAHVALGRTFQQAELYPRAIGAFLDALKIDRENLVAVRQLAECYLKTGDKLEALKKLKLFRGLNPGEKDVSEQIAALEAELQAARRAQTEKRESSTGSFGLRTGPVPRPARTGPIPPLPTGRITAPRVSADTLPGVYMPPAPPLPATAPDFDAVLATPSAPPPPPAFESFFDAPVPAPQPPPVPPPAPEAQAVAHVAPEPAPEPEAEPFAAAAPATGPVLDQEPEQEPVFESYFGGAIEPAAPAAAPEPAPMPEAEPDTEPFATAPAPAAASEEVIWEEETLADRPPVLSAAAVEEEAQVPADLEPQPAPPLPEIPPAAEAVPPAHRKAPTVSETLAELYRSQGYLPEAARTYEALAGGSSDVSTAEVYRTKAAELATAGSAPAARLRAFARRLPEPPSTGIDQMGSVLEGLRKRVPGVRTVVLTDLEGLAVVAAGAAGDSASETLVAELTAFWNSVRRTEDEVGAGALRALSLKGEEGAALVTSVSPEYSLILHVERDVPLGRIRYEAARAAGKLRPALG